MPLFSKIDNIDVVKELPCIFSYEQVQAINNLSLPPTLLFKTATRFDTKRIKTEADVWKYSFSGYNHKIKFVGDNNEIKLKKYILALFVNKNSPVGLFSFNRGLNYLFLFSGKVKCFSYENAVKYLEETKNSDFFYFYLYTIRALCTYEFPDFSYDKLEDLEFIPRPINSSWLNYQDIDNVLSTQDKNMITRGIKEISIRINSNKWCSVTDEELIDCSVLGLCYTCGIRPVQLSRLAVKDLRIDSNSKKNSYQRYSLLIPYAKQQHLILEKILIAIPYELAEILLEYKSRFNKKQDEQFFSIGSSATKFVNRSINRQMLRFAPNDIKEDIKNKLMIQPAYNSYDFRHNVGHSLAMSGASADEISNILGHSSLVSAKHYIMATPELALIRAKALGTNPVWQAMISMMLTGPITSKDEWKGKEVFGIVDGNMHTEIGGCSRSYEQCPFSEVRACYGCLYYHPFIEGDHRSVLSSVKNELLELIELSDSVGCSKNPLIQIQESTKFEVESVIARCQLHGDNTTALITSNGDVNEKVF